MHGAREHNLREPDRRRSRSASSSRSPASPARASRRWSTTSCTRCWPTRSTAPGLVPGRHTRVSGLEHVDKVVGVDQSPIGRTPRSNPATYTGVFDHIRKLFAETTEAKVRGYGPGRFSFNVKGGRCENCAGDGTIKIEMNFLPDVYVPCEVCKGARYNRETLEVHYKGRTIAEVLDMPIEEAADVLRGDPGDPPPPQDPGRGRPGLRAAGPAGADPVRRRGAAGQARQRAAEALHRPDRLRARRADHRPALRGHPQAAAGAGEPGRQGQHGDRHRAQPRRDQDRRLDDRHGPGGRAPGRPGARRRYPRGVGRDPGELHRRSSCGTCSASTGRPPGPPTAVARAAKANGTPSPRHRGPCQPGPRPPRQRPRPRHGNGQGRGSGQDSAAAKTAAPRTTTPRHRTRRPKVTPAKATGNGRRRAGVRGCNHPACTAGIQPVHQRPRADGVTGARRPRTPAAGVNPLDGDIADSSDGLGLTKRRVMLAGAGAPACWA